MTGINSQYKRVIYLASIGLFVLVVLIIAIEFKHVKNQLNDWKLLPEPESLTELYYTHPNSLPTNYVPGQIQTVSFTVHNLENRTTTYNYQIDLSGGSNNEALTSGSFTLKQNQYRYLSVPVTLPNEGPRVQIVTKLINVDESIDYWVKEG